MRRPGPLLLSFPGGRLKSRARGEASAKPGRFGEKKKRRKEGERKKKPEKIKQLYMCVCLLFIYFFGRESGNKVSSFPPRCGEIGAAPARAQCAAGAAVTPGRDRARDTGREPPGEARPSQRSRPGLSPSFRVSPRSSYCPLYFLFLPRTFPFPPFRLRSRQGDLPPPHPHPPIAPPARGRGPPHPRSLGGCGAMRGEAPVPSPLC